MKKLMTGALLAGAPLLAMAQTTNAFSIIGVFQKMMKIAVPMLITFAVIYFIYGVVKYVVSSDSDEKGKAKEVVIRGVVGLFVIVSIWGLVAIIQSTFGIGAGGSLNQSQIPGVDLINY